MTTFRTSVHIAASPDAVFAAMAAPDRLARWWGPAGFRNTFQVFEFVPGGSWRFVMHGPDGTDYLNEAVFAQIDPPRKVVVDHVCPPLFRLTIDLVPMDSGTQVQWVQTFEDPAVAAAIRHIVEPANEENLARLRVEVTNSGAGRD